MFGERKHDGNMLPLKWLPLVWCLFSCLYSYFAGPWVGWDYE